MKLITKTKHSEIMLIQIAYTVFIAIKPVNDTPLIKAMIIEREHRMVMKP